MPDIKVLAKRIGSLAQEVKKYQEQRKQIQQSIEDLKKNTHNKEEYDHRVSEFLKGRTAEGWDSYFDSYIKQLLDEIDIKNNQIIAQMGGSTHYIPRPEDSAPKHQKIVGSQEIFRISKEQKEQFIKELRIDEEYLDLLKPKKEGKELRALKDYTIYETNPYGKMSNSYVGEYTEKLIKAFPELYDKLVH
ncbi:MAG: hypothetical protein L6408_03160 [Nanoarchaeota archaeon]|nr:hypothetical protein [Nanoarchaeota archaeon]